MINIGNLGVCVEDVVKAASDSHDAPALPNNYGDFVERVSIAAHALPRLYADAVAQPFLTTIKGLGERGFKDILRGDPQRLRTAGLMLDIAAAIVQNADDKLRASTVSFEELVADLYDGFLSAEDRAGTKRPDLGATAPLVKWGNPKDGPYTWTVEASGSLNVRTAIVSLPPANRSGGLLTWSALGHETAGHDILAADTGLTEEVRRTVFTRLRQNPYTAPVAEYWAQRIDETASDVLGILNMGPAAAIGMVGFLRGMNGAFGDGAHLAWIDPNDACHPVDIVRGFLAAATVKRLSFDAAGEWARILDQETRRDCPNGVVHLPRKKIDLELAQVSADTVAEVIMFTQMQALDGHSFVNIQDWHQHDEKLVQNITKVMMGSEITTDLGDDTYAAHAVAAAVTGSLNGTLNPGNALRSMQTVLGIMHDKNPTWGPTRVCHRGDIVRRPAFSMRRRTGK